MSMLPQSGETAASTLALDRNDLRAAALLTAIVVFGALFFVEGLTALAEAWRLPEYSHGPLIPVLSGLLFLRHLKETPVQTGPVTDRWPGYVALLLTLTLGLMGKIAQIDDIVAYALIGYVGAIILISFGWRTGRGFWPAVLHLAFMLPLPATLYWKVSTSLQLFSSEVGVWIIQIAGVPVFLDGNIIDLGVYKLHVAEACSGLRYLYPVMSFSYIFASLYRGPIWIKAVLLLSAAPITVMMNSVRIGIIGVIVDRTGLEHVEGITHLLEGWVIFIISIMLLFALVKLMMRLTGNRATLGEALDLDLTGLAPQAMRIRWLKASPAMLAAVATVGLAWAGWVLAPERATAAIERQSLALFPTRIAEWRNVDTLALEPQIERALGADDYLSAVYRLDDAPGYIDVFVAWYQDQTNGGIHSPEVCLPGGGWEMAEIRRIDAAPKLGLDEALPMNRAIIQKGEQLLLVYYWFEQYGGRTASDYVAKASLIRDGVLHGRTDGALARLITPVLPGESVDDAEARLVEFTPGFLEALPRFVPSR